MTERFEARLIWASGDAEVHYFDLDLYRGALVLSVDERARAEAMGSSVERRRFAAHRSIRRALLADAIGVDPLEVRFEPGAHGKPRVPGASLYFSASRSGPHGLLAISNCRQVGVDIQGPADRHTLMEGLKHYLSLPERETVVKPREEATRLLMRLWTRKEAACKALGIGLHGSLKSLNALADEAEWLGCRIRFEDLPEIDGCAACLAILM